MYGDEVVAEENLVIPHKLMHERLFVLLPLYEIYQGPIPGVERTIANLIIDRKEELAGISVFHLV
jgi:2-amino-4-hydroxy-6-hydroxymethyldihydropteridine diphosphokinase